MPCLNRTSVGLKLQTFDFQAVSLREPQSNQRGIETPERLPRSAGGRPPQSNQRGIETVMTFAFLVWNRSASIEPAWD